MNCLHCKTEFEGRTAPQLISDDQIPDTVVRPQVERDGSLAVTGQNMLYRGAICNPYGTQAYAELFYRLTHWPLEKLKSAGHWIPAWRAKAG